MIHMSHIYDKLESLCRACWECSRDRDPPARPPPARVKLDMIKKYQCKEMYYDHNSSSRILWPESNHRVEALDGLVVFCR